MLKTFISKRRGIQALFAFSVYVLMSYFQVSLLYILIFGSILGIVLGKVFCKWVCPIGVMMELIMSHAPEERNRQMYMYHKLGCPIAWISGFFNKFSLLKIKRDPESCINCGKCDKTCYITALNKDYSLYKKNKLDPSLSYKCARCMKCIQDCPAGSLKLKV